MQGAAAALALGYDDFAAVLLKHANGGLVQASEAHIGNAARQKRHAMSTLALRRKRLTDLAEEERRIGRGCELDQIAERTKHVQLAHAARQRLHAAALEQVEQRPRDRHR